MSTTFQKWSTIDRKSFSTSKEIKDKTQDTTKTSISTDASGEIIIRLDSPTDFTSKLKDMLQLNFTDATLADLNNITITEDTWRKKDKDDDDKIRWRNFNIKIGEKTFKLHLEELGHVDGTEWTTDESKIKEIKDIIKNSITVGTREDASFDLQRLLRHLSVSGLDPTLDTSADNPLQNLMNKAKESSAAQMFKMYRDYLKSYTGNDKDSDFQLFIKAFKDQTKIDQFADIIDKPTAQELMTQLNAITSSTDQEFNNNKSLIAQALNAKSKIDDASFSQTIANSPPGQQTAETIKPVLKAVLTSWNESASMQIKNNKNLINVANIMEQIQPLIQSSDDVSTSSPAPASSPPADSPAPTPTASADTIMTNAFKIADILGTRDELNTAIEQAASNDPKLKAAYDKFIQQDPKALISIYSVQLMLTKDGTVDESRIAKYKTDNPNQSIITESNLAQFAAEAFVAQTGEDGRDADKSGSAIFDKVYKIAKNLKLSIEGITKELNAQGDKNLKKSLNAYLEQSKNKGLVSYNKEGLEILVRSQQLDADWIESAALNGYKLNINGLTDIAKKIYAGNGKVAGGGRMSGSESQTDDTASSSAALEQLYNAVEWAQLDIDQFDNAIASMAQGNKNLRDARDEVLKSSPNLAPVTTENIVQKIKNGSFTLEWLKGYKNNNLGPNDLATITQALYSNSDGTQKKADGWGGSTSQQAQGDGTQPAEGAAQASHMDTVFDIARTLGVDVKAFDRAMTLAVKGNKQMRQDYEEKKSKMADTFYQDASAVNKEIDRIFKPNSTIKADNFLQNIAPAFVANANASELKKVTKHLEQVYKRYRLEKEDNEELAQQFWAIANALGVIDQLEKNGLDVPEYARTTGGATASAGGGASSGGDEQQQKSEAMPVSDTSSSSISSSIDTSASPPPPSPAPTAPEFATPPAASSTMNPFSSANGAAGADSISPPPTDNISPYATPANMPPAFGAPYNAALPQNNMPSYAGGSVIDPVTGLPMYNPTASSVPFVPTITPYDASAINGMPSTDGLPPEAQYWLRQMQGVGTGAVSMPSFGFRQAM